MGKSNPIEIKVAMAYLNKISPGLLISGEVVHLAFQQKRDYFIFTTHRILLVETRGVTKKKVEHRSLAYHAIKAFTIETAGEKDGDSELKIYADDINMNIDFNKDLVNIYDFQSYLSERVFPETKATFATVAPTLGKSVETSQKESLKHFLSASQHPLDKGAVEGHLRTLGAIKQGEEVEVACAHAHQMLVGTTKRTLMVTMNPEKKKLQFFNIRYSAARGYSVHIPRGAGSTEFWLLTNLSVNKRHLKMVMPADVDMEDVQLCFNRRMIDCTTKSKKNEDPAHHVEHLNWNAVSHADVAEVTTQLRSTAILPEDEVCHLAFKGNGKLMVLTSKRVLVVDSRYMSNSVSYTTIPYSSIKMFELNCTGTGRTPGVDADWKVGIFTDICYDPPAGKDNSGQRLPPQSGFSYIEMALDSKTTDVLAINRFLSAKLLPLQAQSYAEQSKKAHKNMMSKFTDLFSSDEGTGELLKTSPENTMIKLVNLFSSTSELTTPSMNDILAPSGSVPFLYPNETIFLVYKCGKRGENALLFTTYRILDFDLAGESGPRLSMRSSLHSDNSTQPLCYHYRSIPYSTIRSYQVQSKGTFALGSSLRLHLRAPWFSKIKRNFGLARIEADIVRIDSLISGKVLGKAGKQSDFFHLNNARKCVPIRLMKFARALAQPALDVPQTLEWWLRSSVPLLQANETIEEVYYDKGDYTIITTLRVLLLKLEEEKQKSAKKGKKATIQYKVKFASYPYKYVNGFTVRTVGFFGKDKQVKLYTSEDIKSSVTQDLAKKSDIIGLNNKLGQHTLKSITHVC